MLGASTFRDHNWRACHGSAQFNLGQVYAMSHIALLAFLFLAVDLAIAIVIGKFLAAAQRHVPESENSFGYVGLSDQVVGDGEHIRDRISPNIDQVLVPLVGDHSL